MKCILDKNIPNQQATEKFAKEFYATYLKNTTNAVVFLEGGLGAGKTFIIRTILRTAGIKEEIPSPTYTFLQEYDSDSQHFAHFDLYRLKDPQEFFARGFDEIAADNHSIKFVEWPDKITQDTQDGFAGTHLVIQIKHGVGVGMRKVKILSK